MGDIATRTVEIEVERGVRVAAYAALPAKPEGCPGVLVLGEIWGVNGNIRAICERLAHAGVAALAPDPYRGEAPPRESDPIERVLGFFDRYDDARGIRDCRAALGVLAGGLGFAPSALFAWGFCKGGRFAHYLGAFDSRLAGVINFYGRITFARDPVLKPFTPLDVAGLIEAPYLGLFAERDPLIAADDVAALRAAFERRGHRHHLHIYAGAEHAFFNDTRPSHHPQVAADAWHTALAFITTGALP
jgi:carboxymethylenebutenolidase